MICACCNDPAKTTYEECWLESMSGVPSGVVLIEGRSVYHAFKGEICADCLHDHARPDLIEVENSNGYENHMRWETRVGNFV